MRTGEVGADLMWLDEEARLRRVDALVACNLAGPEASIMDQGDVDIHRGE